MLIQNNNPEVFQNHIPLTYPEVSLDDVKDSLDQALKLDTKHSLQLIRVILYMVYQKFDRDQWTNFVDNCLMKHPIKDLVHKDPFTYRAFSKPRGYAGDAVMIDYIYDQKTTRDGLDELTESVYAVTTNSPSTRAVRNRLNYIVNQLNQLPMKKPQARILSLACGHCRELGLSDVLHENIDKFVAMDQDPNAIELVRKEYSHPKLETKINSVTSLLKERKTQQEYDLIYTLGLYDYLSQSIARRLTLKLFQKLNSGGELVIANFVPDILDVGYMESYMDWQLIYRDKDEMQDLLGEIDSACISNSEIFHEPEKNIIFLKLTRR